MRKIDRIRAVCALCAVAALSGCDKTNYTKTEPVSGVVRYQGELVAGAEIAFAPVESGETASARTNEKGEYALTSLKGAPGKGAVAGEYRVTISQYVTTELAEPYFDKAQDAVISVVSEEKLPAPYTDFETSPLTATVKPGKNEIDFDLVPDVKPRDRTE
ncbi:MAG: carboxypeptidase regulatory-like domain-containing protein [Thermoguttaceae bacterium]|nr:carboxypeptidase regulatory-like domain-containing protein [Thermoguttaceae bacterium]